MSGTGYVAVGHLFKLTEIRKWSSNKSALRVLVSTIVKEVDETIVNPKGTVLFDKFFTDITVSIDSACTFLRGFLKRHDVEDLAFELQVEKIVWKIVRNHETFHQILQKYCHTDDIMQDTCFQLFCLFNRFCYTKKVHMEMDDHSQSFLLKKFGLPEGPPIRLRRGEGVLTFEDFFDNVFPRIDQFVVVCVKRAYDEYVRDILIEGMLQCRTITYPSLKNTEKMKISKI